MSPLNDADRRRMVMRFCVGAGKLLTEQDPKQIQKLEQELAVLEEALGKSSKEILEEGRTIMSPKGDAH